MCVYVRGFFVSVGILETKAVIIATSVLKTSGRVGVISCHGPTVCLVVVSSIFRYRTGVFWGWNGRGHWDGYLICETCD